MHELSPSAAWRSIITAVAPTHPLPARPYRSVHRRYSTAPGKSVGRDRNGARSLGARRRRRRSGRRRSHRPRRGTDRAARPLGRRADTSSSGRGGVPEDDPRCIGNYATSPRVRRCSPTPTCWSRLARTSAPTSLRLPPRAARRAHPGRPRPGHARSGVPGNAPGGRGRGGVPRAVLAARLGDLGDGEVDPAWTGRAVRTRERSRHAARGTRRPRGAL